MAIYEDDAPHVVGAVATLVILAFTSYGLRVYVRFGKTWGAEDWAMTVATVSLTTTTTTDVSPQGYTDTRI